MEGFEPAREISSKDKSALQHDHKGQRFAAVVAGDLPGEVATSGARAYMNKEQLAADTLRRLWDERDAAPFTSA